MTGTRLESKRRSLQRGGLPAWAIPLATAIVGLILGLTWAWLIQPVEYTNADPGNLAPGAQEAWVEMVADSYAITTDSAEARRRLQFFEPDELQGMLAEEVSEAQRAGNLGAEQRLRGLADLLDTQPIRPSPPPRIVAARSARCSWPVALACWSSCSSSASPSS
jgi:hypothetical protein